MVNVLSLRLKRKFMSQQTRAIRLQPRVAKLGLGEDWLTRVYGSFPFSINLWDVIKGVIYGFVSYGLLGISGGTKGKVGEVALRGFLVGGSIGGLEEILDEALYYAYGRDWEGVPRENINSVIHEIFQGFIVDGAISALIVAILKGVK